MPGSGPWQRRAELPDVLYGANTASVNFPPDP